MSHPQAAIVAFAADDDDTALPPIPVPAAPTTRLRPRAPDTSPILGTRDLEASLSRRPFATPLSLATAEFVPSSPTTRRRVLSPVRYRDPNRPNPSAAEGRTAEGVPEGRKRPLGDVTMDDTTGSNGGAPATPVKSQGRASKRRTMGGKEDEVDKRKHGGRRHGGGGGVA